VTVTTEDVHSKDMGREAWQALELWCVFILLLVLVNGTIPFLLGVDMHAWTYSTTKTLIFGSLFYSGLFLIAPLILLKSWRTVRQPAFIIPLIIATVGVTLWAVFPFAAASVLAVLAFLHWRFDLSAIGIRSRGWRGDTVAVLLVGVLYSLLALIQPAPPSFSISNGILVGLKRLFANPASTVENLFYFGFLSERLSHKMGRWLTPFAIGAMYTAHEMSNPEYWYGGVSFGFIFVGVVIITFIYLWRRSVVAVWLSDGFGRFISGFLSP
jgi:hypothetical protein